jgi:hypothetical protein
MESQNLPFPPHTHPWPTSDQLRANDAYRDSLLSPEQRAEKQRQLLELCQDLKAAMDRTLEVNRKNKRIGNK